jgi:integrase
MSVRKRIWFTREQLREIEPDARKLARSKGDETKWRHLDFTMPAAKKLGIEPRETWIVQYLDKDSVDRIRTFARKKDADAEAARVKIDVGKGVHTSSKATVAEAGKKWLADAEDYLEPATVESYRQHFEDHIVPFIGSMKLSQLTVPAVREFMDRLRREKRSPAMVKRVIGDLGSILADAQEWGMVAQNVVRSLNPRRKKRRKAERRQKKQLKIGVHIPAPDEIKAIVTHLKGRWRPVLLTAIFTGLRASELRGLRWADVDLKEATLEVCQRADRYNTIGKPKSASGQRTLRLPPIVVNTLREWKLNCPRSDMDLVFPTGAGGIENLSNILQRGLAPTQIAAGVVTKDGKAKYTGLHSLRHFYASWCINRQKDGGLELPAKVVQHRLGHSSIQVTLDVYGHLFKSTDDGAELAAAQKALLG